MFPAGVFWPGQGVNAAINPAGAFQTIRFPIPAAAKIRKFDEITVMLLSDELRARVGPKIAIREFQLFPR
jgi:hypothetical protein